MADSDNITDAKMTRNEGMGLDVKLGIKSNGWQSHNNLFICMAMEISFILGGIQSFHESIIKMTLMF